MRRLTLLLFILIFISCAQQEEKPSSVITVDELFQTVRDTNDNVDSPAFWKGPNGESWIISTAKSTDILIVDDALTGKNIKRIGGEGTELGKFDRPNGVFVIDDLVVVVERDNRRAQVMRLPDFNSLGTIGDTLLVKPYGLFINKNSNGSYNLYITDNYETPDEQVPPDNELNKRVHFYNFSVEDSAVSWNLVKTFGDTSGVGTLRIVESLWGDAEYNKLLIAEEDETQSSVKVYDFEGNFTGEVFGLGIFSGQVEGISLHECEAGKGYWIITNQSYDTNLFKVFDRQTFEHLGTFTGPKTSNTDGIWLAQGSVGKHERGLFFAVHNDGNVSAFDWGEILDKLKLPYNCN